MTLKGTPKVLLILPLLAAAILAAALLGGHGAPGRRTAFRMPTGSMEPALLAGDHLMVELRPGYRPQRGEVVAFISVEAPGLLTVSRIAAVPGDSVGMSNGELFLNRLQPAWSQGHSSVGGPADSPELREQMARWQAPFLLHRADGLVPDRRNWGPLRVPAGAYLVLGDHRDFSYDSRFWGFLPASHVVGRPRYVYYSYDPHSPRLLPWLSAIRWGRIGQRVPASVPARPN
ncbi:MAG: signal peptidase I [Gemmatimonadetes bacterium]|nr:signal peptidase I [Gemmatimonadota bacterium]MBK7348509.1 signal peptidase I [Gemmatimonadota bacterium]MBK7714078.1 signal peptidase I [Gemmatimonadota bacterium]MBK7783135.1 signal peptidase I [Gemmatimonadota bacterium]MBK7924081.1 signal peptidase I [Gemmatimonadota bacterium]